MKTHLVWVFAPLLLVGCNGIPRPLCGDDAWRGHFTVNSGFPLPYLFQGSAVQWNQDYAVTVGHIPLLPDVAYHCSSGCDMVFIRHPAEGPVPLWRDSVLGEPVTAVGFSPILMDLKGEGIAKSMRVRLSNSSDPTAYAVHDGPIVQGMSGGPVYGRDGAVLGITVGMLFGGAPAFGDLKSSERLSLYLPYDVIRKEWETYSRSLKARLVTARH
ncbi:trypsin-like peptidase domain-containing protein [Pseudomonas sp. 22526]|uniref:trypsin-like peptidase domain-containing protein n=1 Tax=Pseudomonas sp. 22526 TaxID=3453937 RepID=UPI003F86F621